MIYSGSPSSGSLHFLRSLLERGRKPTITGEVGDPRTNGFRWSLLPMLNDTQRDSKRAQTGGVIPSLSVDYVRYWVGMGRGSRKRWILNICVSGKCEILWIRDGNTRIHTRISPFFLHLKITLMSALVVQRPSTLNACCLPFAGNEIVRNLEKNL